MAQGNGWSVPRRVYDVYSSDKVGGEMFLSDTFTFYLRFMEGHNMIILRLVEN